MIAISKLRKAMHEIAEKKGEFTLFALVMRAGAPFGNWDLVASARWLGAGRIKAIRALVKLLAQSMGEESLKEFSRVEIVDSGDPAVRFVWENFPVDDGERRVRNTDLFGLQIEEAIIFRAKKPDKHRNGRPSSAVQLTAGG